MSLAVICHQLRSAENLGSIARLMANFGLSRLILSDPVTHDFRGAEKMAVGAEQVLRDVAVARSLPEALGGCVYAVGTTSRQEVKRREVVDAETALARLKEHASRGPVALVLGGEKRGLSDDELSHCQEIAFIPTKVEQPSMNVSQAAAVLFYLWSRGAPLPASVEGARLEMVQALEAKMQTALGQCGFLNPQAPEHVLKELTRSLLRNGLTQRECEVWLSAFEHVRRVTATARST